MKTNRRYGPHPLGQGVLKIGLAAILKFSSYAELKEVHMCAFTKEEANAHGLTPLSTRVS